MRPRPYRSFVATCLAALIVCAPFTSSAAQTKQAQTKSDKDKDKPKTKEEARQVKEEARQMKQEREYQKIATFARDKYEKDVNFRAEVDESYKRLQREHSEYAFDINMRDSDDSKALQRTEDRVKILDTLYDNPLVQDYVNRVGQSVVPPTTQRLYAFKVSLNPVPEARSLSTGTVYISSGLLSMIDNEAQLAYILGHEITHVEKEHWQEDTLVAQGVEAYNEQQAKKRANIGLGISAASAVLGLGGGRAGGIVAFVGLVAAPTIAKLAAPNTTIAWEKRQEDEADENALRLMLNRNYDAREVPKFYARMQGIARRDQRVQLGFMGNLVRLEERTQAISAGLTLLGAAAGSPNLVTGASVGGIVVANANRAADNGKPNNIATTSSAVVAPEPGKTISAERAAAERAATAERAISGGALAADIQTKLDAGELIGSTAEFQQVMAELKRDNGIRALYYDMFQMARTNLEESIAIRSNDAYAHLYYGKVLKLTARNAGEKRTALAAFVKAIELDKRRVVSEARLFRALAMMQDKAGAQAEVVNALKDYVTVYQREYAGKLPPNMDVIYDYLQEAGDLTWSAAPVSNVQTVQAIQANTAVQRPIAVATSEPASPVTSKPTPSRATGRRRQ
ncbi:MAG: M48 family metalloprotease [Pyrinomonadaceae bacterium MAG19_C2-C3]|nr:M48 family metalloprotease [Pyrinomonadaceae bacterium MAG19_C2-C3]